MLKYKYYKMNLQFNVWKTCLVVLLNHITSVGMAQGNVGVGTSNPHPSAALEITATNKGFLPPRVTTVQRNAIVSPSMGLTIYNSTSNCLETWDGA